MSENDLSSTTIYHNPLCSKSRQTLSLLEQHGINLHVVLYLQTPPDRSTLRKIAEMLQTPVTDLIRFKDKRAKELGLTSRDERSVDEWCTFLAENPALIERPIVVHAGKAAIGRPPENVLALF